MTRDQGYELLTEMVKNQNLVRHGLAVEAIMRALCRELKQRYHEPVTTAKILNQLSVGEVISSQPDASGEFDEEEWGLVGLLHDSDYEVTDKDLNRHTLVIAEKLRQMGESERLINGIQAHAEMIKPNRENLMEKSVYAADELSGLITACALVQPDKKLSSVDVESVLKKFKNKAFAAGAKRENILTCETDLGIPLEEFVRIALEAMKGISPELGL